MGCITMREGMFEDDAGFADDLPEMKRRTGPDRV